MSLFECKYCRVFYPIEKLGGCHNSGVITYECIDKTACNTISSKKSQIRWNNILYGHESFKNLNLNKDDLEILYGNHSDDLLVEYIHKTTGTVYSCQEYYEYTPTYRRYCVWTQQNDDYKNEILNKVKNAKYHDHEYRYNDFY